jgi:hypothetical protein
MLASELPELRNKILLRVAALVIMTVVNALMFGGAGYIFAGCAAGLDTVWWVSVQDVEHKASTTS